MSSLVGRPPKPAEIREMEGNPGKRPIPKPPEPTKGAPKPPAHLTGEALAEWGRMVPELERLNLLTKVDRAALVAYCEAWATYCDAMEDVRRYGTLVAGQKGNLVKNPAFQIAKDSVDILLKIGSRFGWTPVDRMRLAVTPEDDTDEDSPEKVALRLLS